MVDHGSGIFAIAVTAAATHCHGRRRAHLSCYDAHARPFMSSRRTAFMSDEGAHSGHEKAIEHPRPRASLSFIASTYRLKLDESGVRNSDVFRPTSFRRLDGQTNVLEAS
jgi:hypothetical protein